MSGPESTPVAAAIAEVADRLWRAEVDAVPVEPVMDSWPDLTVENAYAVQGHNVGRRVTAGAVVCGRKVGLTSRVSQELLGVHEPNFGALLDDMFVDEADEIDLDALVAPRVEADNASAARVVLGGRVTPVAGLDLRLIGVLFFRNGEIGPSYSTSPPTSRDRLRDGQRPERDRAAAQADALDPLVVGEHLRATGCVGCSASPSPTARRHPRAGRWASRHATRTARKRKGRVSDERRDPAGLRAPAGDRSGRGPQPLLQHPRHGGRARGGRQALPQVLG
jgi:hypothetical protein